MAGRNNLVEQRDSSLRDARRVEEFDDQRQVHIKAKQINGMDLTTLVEAGYSTQDDDFLDALPVVQNVQDLLHQSPAPAMVAFAEVDAHHHHLVVHGLAPYRLRAT